ncbi:MAG: ADOP family duplicated permease [Rhodanobacteraceae bacterium]
MTLLIRELLQSWRNALRRPAFLTLATATLALGIGAAVAVFALIDATLLKAPPYPDPDRLAVLSQDEDAGNWAALSPQQYQLLRKLPGVEHLGSRFVPKDVNVAGVGNPQLVTAWPADQGLLPTLGVRLALGRNFTADEDRPNGSAAAILGYRFWQRHFNADPNVVGKTVSVDGVATPVVGVLPPSFRLDGSPDLLLPYALAPDSHDNDTNLLVLAHLAPGVSISAVGSALDARLQAHAGELGFGSKYQTHFTATSLAANMGAAARPVLLLFFACALCVLLLVAVNLANLMLLRSIARSHAVAVRAALGASTFRLGLPALAEGLLIGAFGAVAGLALAFCALQLARAFIPDDWLAANTQLIGPVAIAFAGACGLAVALLAAAFGTWRGRSRGTVLDLRTRTGGDGHSARTGRALVIAQAALATVLLGSAALLAHSVWKLAQVDIGFDAHNVLVFRLNPSAASYPDTQSVQVFSERLTARLNRDAGVRDVALTTNLPIGSQLNLPVQLPDHKAPPVNPQFRAVSSDAFSTFGIPLLAGRAFSDDDRKGGEPVAIVDAAFQHKYLDDQALGKSLHLALGKSRPAMRVVGVVGNVREFGPQSASPPTLYMPLGQVPDGVMTLLRTFVPLNVALRVTGDPAAYAERARAAFREIAPQQGMAALRLLQRDVDDATAPQRVNATLVGLFAAIALLLAAVGLYSVTAVAVATREREFGVRAALGAHPSRLLRGVLGAGLRDIGIGLAIGLIAALVAARLLDRFLFGIGPADPLALIATLVVLLLSGLAATSLPALRAARVAPMEALRNE